MLRYFKILWRIARMSLVTSLMYKLDWVLGVVTTFFYTLVQVFFVVLLFRAGNVQTIGGFTVWQIILVFIFGQAVWMFAFIFVFDNVGMFRWKVMYGELDHYLLKPVAPEFLMSFQKFGLVESSAMVTYVLATFAYLLIRGDINFGLSQWLMAGLVGLGSLIITFCLYWMAGLVFFYWPNFLMAHWFLSNVSDVGRYPRRVYPSAMQWFLIYVIPLMCVVNPLYDLMDGSLNFWRSLDIFLVTIMFVIIYFFMWKDGLRRYSSAA